MTVVLQEQVITGRYRDMLLTDFFSCERFRSLYAGARGLRAQRRIKDSRRNRSDKLVPGLRQRFARRAARYKNAGKAIGAKGVEGDRENIPARADGTNVNQ